MATSPDGKLSNRATSADIRKSNKGKEKKENGQRRETKAGERKH